MDAFHVIIALQARQGTERVFDMDGNLSEVFREAFHGVSISDKDLDDLESMTENVLAVIGNALDSDKETPSNFVSKGAVASLMGYALRNAYFMGMRQGNFH